MADSPEDAESPVKPRGLWSVMGAAGEADSIESSDEVPRPVRVKSERAVVEESSTAQPLRGLFGIMPQGVNSEAESTTLASTDTQSLVTPAHAGDEPNDDLSAIDADYELVTHSQITQPMPPDWLNGANVFKTHRIDQELRQARLSIICGIASIVLSFLAFRPEVWLSLPAAALGFVAMILGCLVFTTPSVRRGRKEPVRRAAMWAILLGMTGAFLGPVFMSCGHQWRELKRNSVTVQQPIAG